MERLYKRKVQAPSPTTYNFQSYLRVYRILFSTLGFFPVKLTKGNKPVCSLLLIPYSLCVYFVGQVILYKSLFFIPITESNLSTPIISFCCVGIFATTIGWLTPIVKLKEICNIISRVQELDESMAKVGITVGYKKHVKFLIRSFSSLLTIGLLLTALEIMYPYWLSKAPGFIYAHAVFFTFCIGVQSNVSCVTYSLVERFRSINISISKLGDQLKTFSKVSQSHVMIGVTNFQVMLTLHQFFLG